MKHYGRSVRREPGHMNGLEKRYAEYLEGLKRANLILGYWFEGISLKLAPKTFYHPDFLVMTEQGYLEVHEVKGTSKGKPFVEDDAAVKIKVAAVKFPFRFKMAWMVAGQWQEKWYD